MTLKPEPWLLWGQTAAVQLVGLPAVASVSGNSNQLVNVRYKRPDTWSFLFMFQITSIQANVPVSIRAVFDAVIGVGRNTISIPGFCVLEIPPGELTTGQLANRWATEIEHPQAFVGQVGNNVTKQFPASSIAINATVSSTGSINSGNLVQAQVSAFVSPLTHIRPDWYSHKGESHQFAAGEIEGR